MKQVTQFRSGIAGLAVCSAVAFSISTTSEAAGPPARERVEPRVAFTQGLQLRDALALLKRASRKPVLSQLTAVVRKTEQPIPEVPFSGALSAVSRVYQLHWIRRGDSLAFVRRLLDPRESLEMEVPEIAAVAHEIRELTGPICPYPLDTATADHREFVQSLTPEQLRQMQSTGLPFVALPAEQRRLWLRLNTVHAYEGLVRESARTDSLFSAWKRCSLGLYVKEWRTRPATRSIVLNYPDASSETGTSQLQAGALDPHLPDDDEGTPSIESIDSGHLVPLRKSRFGDGFAARVRFADGESTLSELVSALEKAAQVRIAIPEYAQNRKLLAYVDAVPADEVLRGLEDMYGWTFRRKKGSEYILGRVRPDPARDAEEFRVKLNLLLPPVLRANLEDDRNLLYATEAREQFSNRVLVDEFVRRNGLNGRSLPVGDLAPEVQERFANDLFYRRMSDDVARHARRKAPPGWLTRPEQGWLSLSGELGPGKHPALKFGVTLPNGDRELWGWFIGTNSQEKP